MDKRKEFLKKELKKHIKQVITETDFNFNLDILIQPNCQIGTFVEHLKGKIEGKEIDLIMKIMLELEKEKFVVCLGGKVYTVV